MLFHSVFVVSLPAGGGMEFTGLMMIDPVGKPRIDSSAAAARAGCGLGRGWLAPEYPSCSGAPTALFSA